ncbi:hypothetical protein [Mesorhizobium sp.]|uniref:hypothetical protein n=1 Tax=Mesorhizobium sp. TaxID=1871066 RepID=UPI000FE53887|nr:hypothetical protein [Mesorhizobium sp.]RWD82935.1 MAG: hypothetical protein EOS39_29720 [Mesorhizobium sp.]RWD83350.1 MAG: hypothetical protein EOS38_25605 [Mesorhizobium sp.]
MIFGLDDERQRILDAEEQPQGESFNNRATCAERGRDNFFDSKVNALKRVHLLDTGEHGRVAISTNTTVGVGCTAIPGSPRVPHCRLSLESRRATSALSEQLARTGPFSIAIRDEVVGWPTITPGISN